MSIPAPSSVASRWRASARTARSCSERARDRLEPVVHEPRVPGDAQPGRARNGLTRTTSAMGVAAPRDRVPVEPDERHVHGDADTAVLVIYAVAGKLLMGTRGSSSTPSAILVLRLPVVARAAGARDALFLGTKARQDRAGPERPALSATRLLPAAVRRRSRRQVRARQAQVDITRPTPTQRVTSARRPPLHSSSRIAVSARRAPLARADGRGRSRRHCDSRARRCRKPEAPPRNRHTLRREGLVDLDSRRSRARLQLQSRQQLAGRRDRSDAHDARGTPTAACRAPVARGTRSQRRSAVSEATAGRGASLMPEALPAVMVAPSPRMAPNAASFRSVVADFGCSSAARAGVRPPRRQRISSARSVGRQIACAARCCDRSA